MKILVIDLEGIKLDWFLTNEKLENIRQLIEIGGYGALSGTQLRGLLAELALESGDFFVWDLLAETGKKSILISQSPYSLQAEPLKTWMGMQGEIRSPDDCIALCAMQFSLVREVIATNDWDFLQIIEEYREKTGTTEETREDTLREYLLALDYEIGLLLQTLTDEVILLVSFQYPNTGSAPDLTAPVGESWFILASANNPLLGDLGNVGWDEIVPTLFELAGFTARSQFSAPSLVASRASEILARNDLAPDEAEIIRERLSGLGYIS
jgi:hypothetical protein